jgi:hypothetical protein
MARGDGRPGSYFREFIPALLDFWLFRHFSGLRSQIQTATVEQDGGGEVLFVAETTRGVLDPLDLGVDGFAGSIRDPMAEVGKMERRCM